jgi:hypothetical protein
VKEFLDPTSIQTLGGAAAVVTAVTNTLKQVFGLPPLKTAFVASIAIALLRVVTSAPTVWLEWLFALVNGAILYCTAAGMNQFVRSWRSKRKRRFAPPTGSPDRFDVFFPSWFDEKQ